MPIMLWHLADRFSSDLPVKQKVVHDTTVMVMTSPATVAVPVATTPTVCPPVVAATPAPRDVLVTVFFAKDSATLDSAATARLDALVAFMKANPSRVAAVQGRASAEGPKAHNLVLSKNRADAVADYMTAHGVDAHRMVSSGSGGVGAPGNKMNRNTIVIVLVQ